MQKNSYSPLKLQRNFYNQPAIQVAQQLLGCHLVHNSTEGTTIGKIVETEAYVGPQDQASHARNGLCTNRTMVQFGPGGYAYIYIVYGIHCCFNVVTAPPGYPEVVLIRALEPMQGMDLMAQRRKISSIASLTSGPGRLTQAMGLNMLSYGEDLCREKIFITYPSKTMPYERILATKRINIDYAGISKELFWRFIVRDSPFVSVRF